LPEGSRTEDAIAAAGGLASDADTAGLNRAAILADGQQVIVPSMPPVPAPDAPSVTSDEGSAASGPSDSVASGPSAGDSAAEGDAANGLVNINTADEYALQGLPDIGPILARKIIDYREKHGAFAAIDDIQKVEGIGPATFAKLAPLIAV
jgi:competence protein ComEA